MVDQSNCTVLHYAVEYLCLLVESIYSLNPQSSEPGDCSSSGATSTDKFTECEDYFDIVKFLCEVNPKMVHVAVKDRGDTPLDIPQVILYSSVDDTFKEGSDAYSYIQEIYAILKQASIKVYCSQKKQWEADRGLPCIHHENIDETRERSLPSLAEASKTHGANSTITSTKWFGSEKQSL